MLGKSPKLVQQPKLVQPKFDWAIYGWAKVWLLVQFWLGQSLAACPVLAGPNFSFLDLKFFVLGSNTDFPFFGQFHIPQKTKTKNSARGILFLGTSLFIYEFFLIIHSLNTVEFNFNVFNLNIKVALASKIFY